ncbi:hypothetical protein G6F24_017330 [Rhizopus arrhizus]|nr:hypothetical protein G6F24_017330 [Rhizopus arrhizus]
MGSTPAAKAPSAGGSWTPSRRRVFDGEPAAQEARWRQCQVAQPHLFGRGLRSGSGHHLAPLRRLVRDRLIRRLSLVALLFLAHRCQQPLDNAPVDGGGFPTR